jgi:hypothetical protein
MGILSSRLEEWWSSWVGPREERIERSAGAVCCFNSTNKLKELQDSLWWEQYMWMLQFTQRKYIN